MQIHISKEDKVQSKALTSELKKLQKSLPESIIQLLTILEDTSNDADVTVASTEEEFISPNEAALILKASRPYVRKLIDEGVLHNHKIGSHFKVNLSEVKALKASWEPKNKENFDKLNSSLDNLLNETGWDDK